MPLVDLALELLLEDLLVLEEAFLVLAEELVFLEAEALDFLLSVVFFLAAVVVSLFFAMRPNLLIYRIAVRKIAMMPAPQQ